MTMPSKPRRHPVHRYMTATTVLDTPWDRPPVVSASSPPLEWLDMRVTETVGLDCSTQPTQVPVLLCKVELCHLALDRIWHGL